MPNNFFTDQGNIEFDDLEDYFATDYWIIDQYIGDTLWTWGANTGSFSNGNLGINNSINRSTPVTTFAGGTDWKQVNSSVGIKIDGTLWTWGINSVFSNGRLGTNDIVDRSTPVTTFAGGTNWKQVSGGGSWTTAIKTDGTLWVWGNNSNAQLGTNDLTNRLTPVTTFAGGTDWKQTSCGRYYTVAIKTDGTLWSWGYNTFGQLGNNNTVNTSTPVTTFAGGTDWKQVSAGANHTGAIKNDGTLWMWGIGSNGRLGTNNPSQRNTPTTTFAGGTNWKQVSSGGYHTAALKTDGTLWTWGENNRYLELSTNDATTRNTPVTTFAGGTNWKQIGSGGTSAIKTDGTLWIWGTNSSGQLGTNDTVGRTTPVTTFAGGTNWKQISGSMAVKSGIELDTGILT